MHSNNSITFRTKCNLFYKLIFGHTKFFSVIGVNKNNNMKLNNI